MKKKLTPNPITFTMSACELTLSTKPRPIHNLLWGYPIHSLHGTLTGATIQATSMSLGFGRGREYLTVAKVRIYSGIPNDNTMTWGNITLEIPIIPPKRATLPLKLQHPVITKMIHIIKSSARRTFRISCSSFNTNVCTRLETCK